MADQQSESPQAGRTAPNEATLQIIWIALLASLGMYGVVGVLLFKPNSGAMPPDTLNLIAMMMAGLAIGQTALAMLAPSIFKSLPSASRHILRWALAESIAVCGLVLRFMGGSTTWFYMFLGWSALLMLTLRPGQQSDEVRK